MKRFIREYASDISKSFKENKLYPKDRIPEIDQKLCNILRQFERGIITTNEAMYLLLQVSEPGRYI